MTRISYVTDGKRGGVPRGGEWVDLWTSCGFPRGVVSMEKKSAEHESRLCGQGLSPGGRGSSWRHRRGAGSMARAIPWCHSVLRDAIISTHISLRRPASMKLRAFLTLSVLLFVASVAHAQSCTTWGSVGPIVGIDPVLD